MMTFEGRTADHPVHRLFLERWSPRAFSGESIDRETLLTMFEAARWAPSSYNSQPWRYIYALRDTPAWPTLLGLLIDVNQAWASQAAALVIALSKLTMIARGTEMPSHSHSFDAGAGWQNLALQASSMGFHAHAMVGFDMERAANELHIPSGYRVEAAIAIGKIGDKSKLPPHFQAMESPNVRNPVDSFAFEGTFPPS